MDEKFKIKNSGSKSREYIGIKISNKNEVTNESYETFLQTMTILIFKINNKLFYYLD